ncbi:CWF19-like protein 1 [Cydia strobilella]|uniref:CWF19-like protein 1 n=1 Tax=Cydia strobilella TaxID=1100964 RepID=UPI003006B6EC
MTTNVSKTAVPKAPEEVVSEIKKFKDALRNMYASSGKAVVFFERNFRTSHMQIQCVPVPRASEPQLLEVFQDEAGINSVQIEVLPPYSEMSQVTMPGMPYFHAELPSGEQLFANTKPNFPLQFGR